MEPTGDIDDSLIGQQLDARYEVLGLLGEGGMGRVYRARHLFSGGEVAVKVLRAAALSIPGVLERVKREAIAASAIGDAHIVDVRDFGTLASGEPFMVMELLDGTELSELVHREQELSVERVCHIADQIACALGAAHDAGIVHRDLKSENVLLVERPHTPDFVKLVDFGIAHVQNETSKITRAGELLGTPEYMSPEQCSGQPVDHRTDVYALGVLLYELLTGGLPFESDDLRVLLLSHLTETPRAPSTHREALPTALDELVLRCLAKRPEQRFQSMSEVRAALAGVPGFTPAEAPRVRAVTPSHADAPEPILSEPPSVEPHAALAVTLAAVPVAGAPTFSAPPGPHAALAVTLAAVPATGAPTFSEPPVPEPAVPAAVPPRRTLALGIGLAGLVGVAAFSWLVLSPSDAPRAEAPPPPSRALEPAPVPAARPPSPPPPPPQAEPIVLDSVPGALVHDVSGTRIGPVPLRLPRPTDTTPFEVVVSCEGYRPRRVWLSAVSADSIRVPLDPVRRARATPRATQPAAPAPAPSETVVDPAPSTAAEVPDTGPTRRRPFLDPWS